MSDRQRADDNPRFAHAEGRVVQTPDLSSWLWRAVSDYRPRKYPRATGILALWLFGLFAVFLSPAPVKITPEKLARFDQLVAQVSMLTFEISAAVQKGQRPAFACTAGPG